MTYRAPINVLLALNHGAGLKATVAAGHYGKDKPQKIKLLTRSIARLVAHLIASRPDRSPVYTELTLPEKQVEA
jgi:acyl-CoA dehydrogenase